MVQQVKLLPLMLAPRMGTGSGASCSTFDPAPDAPGKAAKDVPRAAAAVKRLWEVSGSWLQPSGE